MKRVVLAVLLATFTTSAIAASCGTNSGKRYYNGRCV